MSPCARRLLACYPGNGAPRRGFFPEREGPGRPGLPARLQHGSVSDTIDHANPTGLNRHRIFPLPFLLQHRLRTGDHEADSGTHRKGKETRCRVPVHALVSLLQENGPGCPGDEGDTGRARQERGIFSRQRGHRAAHRQGEQPCGLSDDDPSRRDGKEAHTDPRPYREKGLQDGPRLPHRKTLQKDAADRLSEEKRCRERGLGCQPEAGIPYINDLNPTRYLCQYFDSRESMATPLDFEA